VLALSTDFGKESPGYLGFDDPRVDSDIQRASVEVDAAKRRAITSDLQRYLAQKMYVVRWPGGASVFDVAWPVLGNYGVYRGGRDESHLYHIWIDETKAPIRRA
jgi:hypothetical protein